MKRLFYLLLLILFSKFSIGQDLGSPTKARQLATAYLRNKTVDIEGLTFDYRQLRHYGEDALRTMDPLKRRQIHYLYTESYRIVASNSCNDFILTDFDVAQYEIYRKETSNAIIEYTTTSGCKISIELIARNTLSENILKIK
jgi:hypothetical protein